MAEPTTEQWLADNMAAKNLGAVRTAMGQGKFADNPAAWNTADAFVASNPYGQAPGGQAYTKQEMTDFWQSPGAYTSNQNSQIDPQEYLQKYMDPAVGPGGEYKSRPRRTRGIFRTTPSYTSRRRSTSTVISRSMVLTP